MSSREPEHQEVPPAAIVLGTIFLCMVPWAVYKGTPIAWRLVGRVLGFLLTKKTEGRRSVLVSAMDEENDKWAQEHADSKSSSSDEWEKVAGAEAAVAEKLKDKTKDWDGIIGFFHPFWYAM